MDMPVTTLLGVELPSSLPSSQRNPLGLFPVLARSTVEALAAFPELRDPHGRSNGDLHLGFQLLFGGVAFSAVLKHADRRTPGDLAEHLLELYKRAGRGELPSKDRDGATFWIIDSPFAQDPTSTALLDGPVLGLSRPGGRRTLPSGSPRRSRSSSLSLTYESRWIRAGAATSFLSRVKKGLDLREGKHSVKIASPDAAAEQGELVR
jgi:pyruvate/2-oxoglutarate dehydrogenase complex dihydrolipoamide acyltransferase (E2) component